MNGKTKEGSKVSWMGIPLSVFLLINFLPPQKRTSFVQNELIVTLREGAKWEPKYVNGSIKTGYHLLDSTLHYFDVTKIEMLFPWPHRGKNSKPLSRVYRIHFKRGNLEELANNLKAFDIIENVEPIGIHYVYVTPNDPYFQNQWYLDQANNHDIDAPEAWNIEKGDSSVVIGVIDTGVLTSHPDLLSNIWHNPGEIPGNGIDDDQNGFVDDTVGWDFVNGSWGWGYDWYPGEDSLTADNDPSDFNGHGTNVAGIAAAVTNNSMGVSGISWNSKIMPLRIGGSALYNGYEVGLVRMDWAAQAIVYAVDNGAHIINSSWGSSSTGGMSTAVQYAQDNGVLICHAAGNDNTDSPDYLSSRQEVLTVAATDGYDHKASFSNYGTWVDISAPGVYILNTYSSHYSPTYAYLSGTSMASPVVAGVAALVKSLYPSFGATELFQRLTTTADPIDSLNPSYAGLLGAGKVNAFKALGYSGRIQVAPDTIFLPWTKSYDTLCFKFEGPIVSIPTTIQTESKATLATPSWPCYLDSVSFFFTTSGAFSSKACSLFVWTCNSGFPDSLIYKTPFDATLQENESKWVTVNLSTDNIFVLDDFFFGERENSTGEPTLTMDLTDTTGDFVLGDNGWESYSADFMMMVFVKYTLPADSFSSYLWIENVGETTLTIVNIEASDNWVTQITPRSVSINPGDRVPITITTDTTGLTPGLHESSIVIYSDDVLNPTKEVPIILNIGTTGTREGTSIDWRPHLRVGPVPCRGEIYVNIKSDGKPVRVMLYDAQGRIVSKIEEPKEKVGETTIKIPTRNIKSGVYFVLAEIGDRRFVKKVMVIK